MFVKGIEETGISFESVYGKIEVQTSCRDGKIRVFVRVPANTSAVLVLPEKEGEVVLGSGTYEYEYKTDTSLTVKRFSLDSTLSDVLAQPLAVEMFNRMAPGMLEGPMIQFAYQMTFAEMLEAAPDARPLYEAVIDALNEQEEEKKQGIKK